MNLEKFYLINKNKNSILKNSTLLLISYASVFFPRFIQNFGIPALINFVHFGIVPVSLGIAIFTSKSKDRRQNSTTIKILIALFIFLTIGMASALLNKAGLINVILSYLLWAEPFLLLLAITCLPFSAKRFEYFRSWIIYFNIFHLLLALFQAFVLKSHWDLIQGVFFFSGAGHVVGSAVSLTFSLFYLTSRRISPIWFRLLIVLASFIQLLVADTKQTLLALILAFVLLYTTKTKNIAKSLIYIILIIVFASAFYWAIFNIDSPALYPYKSWISRSDLYGPDGAALPFKMYGINAILENFHSPLNWLLGLGPGHTLDRFAGMLRDYQSLLFPLGATTTPVVEKVWPYAIDHWLGPKRGSSLFVPMFGWAGIWGDLGFLGLISYLYICAIVWTRICVDDFCKLLMLSVGVNGLIFTQMQEPGYTLSIAVFIALRWHEKQILIKQKLEEQLEYTQ